MTTVPIYFTNLGATYFGDALNLIKELDDNSVDLIITSPPFALLRKKEYGNEEQNEYVEWLGRFAEEVKPKLKQSGSLVIDLGGSYQRGKPVRSLYNYKVLIYLCDVLGYRLAEEFFWYNPSKLPSPIEWVNKRKIRTKDSVNTIWWLCKSDSPKSDVSNVLVPYSERMKKLIENPDKYYRPKKRPSGHDISASFGKDNGGAIPSNLLTISNSESNGKYLSLCKEMGVKPHPARFPSKLPEFFVKMLTDEGDMVVDIFGGSCTTGEVCECLGRNWKCFEIEKEYIIGSVFRFLPDSMESGDIRQLIQSIADNQPINLKSIDIENNIAADVG